jgi:dephospho-CoA kinase
MGKKTKKKGLLVGITGGIGAGKSTVCRVFREAGYPVFSADEIAREVVQPGSPALAEIAQLFGPAALGPDGSLDRAYARERISRDPSLRRRLEAITHPRIQARAQELTKQAFSDGHEVVFYEAPLLFEAKSDREMDKVICVHAPDEIRLARVMARDGSTREQAERLLVSQMPQAEKIRRADFLLENGGGEEELRRAARNLLAQIKAGI